MVPMLPVLDPKLKITGGSIGDTLLQYAITSLLIRVGSAVLTAEAVKINDPPEGTIIPGIVGKEGPENPKPHLFKELQANVPFMVKLLANIRLLTVKSSHHTFRIVVGAGTITVF
jgi:hypothetical protein